MSSIMEDLPTGELRSFNLLMLSNLVQYLMYNSPYWMDLAQMWVDWPVRELGGTFKWYYLVQYAFWLQQIFVLNIEERRKDYHQMFAHHIVTCMLIFASYT